jgi:bifunctional DNA-binding transcriptional regulator/antitoxin component of YhaV-PrlF toxin-antitoxin module
MNKIKKELKRSEDLLLQFTEDEVEYFGLREGDKFSVSTDGESIILTPYAELEIDLDEFDKETLQGLIKLSFETGKNVEEVIEEVLTNFVEEFE